jgi:ATP/maltotriose-dependent transcriptional regulator MalT
VRDAGLKMSKAVAFETPPMLRRRLVQLALRTASQVLLIQGPPGSGKTVLLRQLADALQAGGHEVTLHRSLPPPHAGRVTRAELAAGDSARRYLLIDGADTSGPEPTEWVAVVRRALEQGERCILALRDSAMTTAIQSALPGLCSRIGALALNFTQRELADFIHVEEHGLVANELHQFTDGWALAVRIVRDELAAESNTPSPEVISEAASQRIFQYFDAVLPTLMTSLQLDALAMLRDLQVLAAEFLAAFAPDGHYEQILRELSLRGLFVFEETLPKPRFHLHAVLRRYLRVRFAGLQVDCDNARGAAELLARRGHMRPALHFAAAAAIPGLMTSILDRLGGLSVPLHIGLDAVPYFQIESIENSRHYPAVLLGRIYCALQQGRIGYGRDLYRALNERGLLAGSARIELWTALMGLILRLYESDRIQSGELDSLQAQFVSELSDDDLAQGILYQLQSSVFYDAGDTRHAYASARRVFEIAASVEAPFFKQYAKFYLALTQLRLGTLSSAEALLKSAIAVSEQEFGAPNSQGAQARILLARIYVERLQIDAAAVLIEENSDAADLYATWRDAVEAHVTASAFVALHRGGLDAALPALDERLRAFQGAGLSACARKIQLLKVQLLLAYGRVSEALTELTCGDEELQGRVLSLRLRVESGQDVFDSVALGQVAEEIKQSGDVFLLLALRILTARCHARQGRAGAAAASLNQVLETASRFGLYASLAVEWQGLSALLTDAISAALTAQELATLERAKTFGRPRPPEGQDLVYPELGRRERQVLEYLALGMSSKEMAQRLNISIGTVKGYRRSLFEKLGIFRRSEAVAIARTLVGRPSSS